MNKKSKVLIWIKTLTLSLRLQMSDDEVQVNIPQEAPPPYQGLQGLRMAPVQ